MGNKHIIKNSRDRARPASTRNFTPKTLSNGVFFRFMDLYISTSLRLEWAM